MLHIDKKIGKPLIKRNSSKLSLNHDLMNASCIGLNESILNESTGSTESKKDMPIYNVFLLVNLS